jgi:hypothetical protein
MGRQATSYPAFLPVPRSNWKELEKMISMAEVILLVDDDS